jgi:hypothetical protein
MLVRLRCCRETRDSILCMLAVFSCLFDFLPDLQRGTKLTNIANVVDRVRSSLAVTVLLLALALPVLEAKTEGKQPAAFGSLPCTVVSSQFRGLAKTCESIAMLPAARFPLQRWGIWRATFPGASLPRCKRGECRDGVQRAESRVLRLKTFLWC